MLAFKEMVRALLLFWDWAGLFYFALVNGLYLWMAWRALKEIQLRKRLRRLYWSMRTARGCGEIPVSIICPAYNEGKNIVQSVQSLLGINLPNLEVVVVNDGSTDGTLDELVRAFELYPSKCLYEPVVRIKPVRAIYASQRHQNLVVVDKENGGKAD
ncbi:MAG: Glycosyl transferase family 2 [Thermoanaerobacterales bacterium 50_218]|nr:MAG: Glycosyl transferase family 2 [Thermoanaerobacterales bacterium 50_218]HAA89885.1 hypothetical protein [Peptococcaceae bacterium]